MKKSNELIIIAVSLFSLLIIPGCEKDDSISVLAYTIEGQYQYYGYNIDSTLYAYGNVNIILTDTTITGLRNIQVTDTTNSQYREAGTGDISGFMYSDSSFFIYLMGHHIPDILLRGKFSAGLITGERILETGARPQPPVIGFYTLKKQ
jgi:hypothetical protein